jgi:hypothetical protein
MDLIPNDNINTPVPQTQAEHHHMTHFEDVARVLNTPLFQDTCEEPMTGSERVRSLAHKICG